MYLWCVYVYRVWMFRQLVFCTRRQVHSDKLLVITGRSAAQNEGSLLDSLNLTIPGGKNGKLLLKILLAVFVVYIIYS